MSHTRSSLKGAACAALVLALIAISSLRITSIVTAAPQTASAGDTMAAAPVKWSSIGPRDAGGSGGKVNAFAYVQSNPLIMYLGGGWGNTPRESPSQMGIYRTSDGGAHWRAANQGLTNPD